MSTKKQLQYRDIYWYAGVLIAFLISFYLRAVIPIKSVFVGNEVIFSSESDAWYHMMLAIGTVMNHQRLWFDPMTYFPHGTPLHFGPFNSWGIAIISLILGMGHPSMHTIDAVGAFFPAILGALLVVPAYFLGREIGGKSCGLISALIMAVLPGQVFARSVLGFTDHHAAESFLSALAMMFFVLAMSSGQDLSFESIKKNWPALKMPLVYSVLAGISLGLYIDAWSSGFLFEGVILAFIVIQSIVDHLKGRNAEYPGIAGAITFLLATLLVLPFVQSYYGFNNYLYTLFQPTILLAGTVASILIAFLSKSMKEKNINKYYFPGVIVVIIVLGLMVLSLAIPSFTGNLFTGLNIFRPKTGGASTVQEISPLLFEGGQFSLDGIQSNFPGVSVVLSPFFLAIIALALLFIRYIKNQKNTYLLIIIWSIIILFLTLAQVRFAYYYAVNVALLTGFLAAWALQKAGYSELEGNASELKDIIRLLGSNLKAAVVAMLIIVLLIYPSASLSVLMAEYTSGPESDWLSSVKWLENNTPSPGMDLYKIYQRPPDGQEYPYPPTAYGVMSWWDYGHYIETIGHRMPNANPFQQGIGNLSAGMPGSSPFFLSESEDQAEGVLKNLDESRSPYQNTRYVMIDVEMATSKFGAMAAWSSIPGSKYIAAVYQPQGETLVPIQVWQEPYFKTMTARLFFFDGTETPASGGIGIAYQGVALQDGSTVPVIVESPKISENYSELMNYVNESRSKGYLAEIVSESPLSTPVPLEALQHYRLVHESETKVTTDGQKFVKTFEHVPGAVIEGNASAGTKATISVPIMTNQNREFTYMQSNITDSSGRFTLVVPYSTEGPSTSGTKFDTSPIGPYQLTVEDKKYDVKVPEEMVMTGGVIKV